MEQKVNLVIAGRQFQLKANTPEMEQSMRIAAEDINKMLDRYTEKYPDKELVEMLLFVTLTQAVSRIDVLKKLNEITAEGAKLAGDLSEYLKNIEPDRAETKQVPRNRVYSSRGWQACPTGSQIRSGAQILQKLFSAMD